MSVSSGKSTFSLSSQGLSNLMQEVLERCGSLRVRVRGASMVPFVRDGDIVTVAPLAERPPDIGDVISYRRSTGSSRVLVIHRVVGIHASHVAVLGDGNGRQAEVVSTTEIIGRVIRLERNGRDIRLGLGPERRFIAWVSRARLLWRPPWSFGMSLGRIFSRLRLLRFDR